MPNYAWYCDAGNHQEIEEMIEGWPRYSEIRLFGIVVAETRNKAKTKFLDYINSNFMGCDVEYIDIRTRKIMEYKEDIILNGSEPHQLWEEVDRRNLWTHEKVYNSQDGQ